APDFRDRHDPRGGQTPRACPPQGRTRPPGRGRGAAGRAPALRRLDRCPAPPPPARAAEPGRLDPAPLHPLRPPPQLRPAPDASVYPVRGHCSLIGWVSVVLDAQPTNL